MKVLLYYTAFCDTDVITRSVKIINEGTQAFYLTKVLSACLDMDNQDYEMISLHGSWARERHIQRKKVGYGIQKVSSFRGESSHQDHPFLALVSPNTTQEMGEVYAMNFVYSGNFQAQLRCHSLTVSVCPWESILRISAGSWSRESLSRHRRLLWYIPHRDWMA